MLDIQQAGKGLLSAREEGWLGLRAFASQLGQRLFIRLGILQHASRHVDNLIDRLIVILDEVGDVGCDERVDIGEVGALGGLQCLVSDGERISGRDGGSRCRKQSQP